MRSYIYSNKIKTKLQFKPIIPNYNSYPTNRLFGYFYDSLLAKIKQNTVKT